MFLCSVFLFHQFDVQLEYFVFIIKVSHFYIFECMKWFHGSKVKSY